jgi:hypothetical protein
MGAEFRLGAAARCPSHMSGAVAEYSQAARPRLNRTRIIVVNMTDEIG